MTKLPTVRCIALAPDEAAAFASITGSGTPAPSLIVRPLKPQPNPQGSYIEAAGELIWCEVPDIERICGPVPKWHTSRCPWGAPGTRLVGRESFCYNTDETAVGHYAVDPWTAAVPRGLVRWRPAVTMPARLARTHLRLLGVRVVRVREITRPDAIAAGCPMPTQSEGMHPWPEVQFRSRWNATFGKQFPWESSWVWLLSVAPWRDGEVEVTI